MGRLKSELKAMELQLEVCIQVPKALKSELEVCSLVGLGKAWAAQIYALSLNPRVLSWCPQGWRYRPPVAIPGPLVLLQGAPFSKISLATCRLSHDPYWQIKQILVNLPDLNLQVPRHVSSLLVCLSAC